MKCYSFFKVGGGFKAEDYASIRHHTDGKWIDWDPKQPPTEFIELGGGDLQYERPDVWIKPCDSVVVSVKAASVSASDQFRMGFTLRFPRFKRLRMDRSWDTALSIQEFIELKARVERESKEKEFKIDSRRRATKKIKREIVIAGNDQTVKIPFAGPKTDVFEGLNFCILSESLKPQKKSKAELEQLVKANGGKIFQSPTAAESMICIADKKVVKAASLMKGGDTNIIRPAWLFDALMQSEADIGKPKFVLPWEAGHMFFIIPRDEESYKKHVDRYGDSYARDVGVDELMTILEGMKGEPESDFDVGQFVKELNEHGHSHDIDLIRGWMFRNLQIYMDYGNHLTTKSSRAHLDDDDLRLKLASNLVQFSGARVVDDLADQDVTHVVVEAYSSRLSMLRKEISNRKRLPRIVTVAWVEDSWKEGTLLDEERYAPTGGGRRVSLCE